MNRTNLKCASVQTFINGDLGQELEKFLRGEVEIAGMQIIISGNQKIAYIDYEDRDYVAKKCQDNGIEFEDYMKKDYYHAIEVSVPFTKDLAEKINEVKSSNDDIETVATYYYNATNTKNALILYASRKEFEKHEEEQKASQEAKAKARAEELAKTTVQNPDMESLDKVDDILNKYASVETETQETSKKDNETIDKTDDTTEVETKVEKKEKAESTKASKSKKKGK